MASEPAGRRAAAGRRLGIGAALILVVIAFAATIAVGMLRTSGSPASTVPTAVVTGVASPAEAVYVHVAGAVVAPGLYVLTGGARVVDAIAAAGGFGADADRAAVNLARPLTDGEQLRVPVEGEAPADASEHAGGDARVNLNTADAFLLDTLPGVGPALSQRIIEWRAANGGFSSVEDLLDVPGFGDKMVDGLRDLVTV